MKSGETTPDRHFTGHFSSTRTSGLVGIGSMTTAEAIYERALALPESRRREALHYLEYLLKRRDAAGQRAVVAKDVAGDGARANRNHFMSTATTPSHDTGQHTPTRGLLRDSQQPATQQELRGSRG